MCVASIAFGAYSATYETRVAGTLAGSTQDLGLVDGAWLVQQTPSISDITADYWGDAVIDGIYRGMNMALVVTFKEWKESVLDAVWQFDESPGVAGIHGRCVSDMAGRIVLTATTGTPAASLTPGNATWTFPYCLIMPQHTLEIPLGNEERLLRMTFRVYPTVVAGTSSMTYYTHTGS